MSVTLTGEDLTVQQVVAVAREGERVALADEALRAVAEARTELERRVEAGEVMYGVNTGFGALADEVIDDPEQLGQLQVNLVRSHAVGVGDPLPAAEVRAMALLRLNSLLSGRSGVRVTVVERLRDLLNAGVHPHVPRKGSVSASGDLAPLAHLALVLLGEGKARQDGEWLPAGEVLADEGIDPLELRAKEGLALVNGTNYVTAVGALAVHDAERLARTADVVGATSLEALRGIGDPFDPRIHELRGHPGQEESAARIRAMAEDSDLVTTAREADHVQDSYSLRCMPQVHGASLDQIAQAREVIARELNAVTDNPLVLQPEDGEGIDDVYSGGNFHAQPIALALDSLTAAVAELADVAERRVFKLTGGDEQPAVDEYVRPAVQAAAEGESPGAALEELGLGGLLESVAAGERSVEEAMAAVEERAGGAGRLPRFLAGGDTPGLNSGVMMPQVTAAALVSENRTLAHPDSTDSVPTSDDQEDHVSMGANAANHLREVLDNTATVLGIELFAATQALEFREADPSAAAAAVRETVRDAGVAPLERDRYMADDLETVAALVEDGAVLDAYAENR